MLPRNVERTQTVIFYSTLEAKHLVIELLRSIEVVDIQNGFF